MRTRIVRPLAAASFAALVAAGGSARAQQVDTNPPLPNVLLLVDTSGSMERMINGNTPETDPNANTPSGTNACNCVDNGPGNAPTCNFTAAKLPQPNRWAIVQEAMTGSLTNGFSCVAMPRNSGASSTFATEYQIKGGLPYDNGYFLPFHRMVAADPTAAGASTLNPAACVVAPGGLNGAPSGSGVGLNGAGLGGLATDFSGTCSSGQCTGSIVTRDYGLFSSPVSCTFAQNNDGVLTQMKDVMRFGLMTFDQDPDQGIGVSTGSNPAVNNTPFQGMWSYFPGWNTGATCPFTGNPANCANVTPFAVGARNPAAPAWEGRLMPFPTTNDLTTQETNNARVGEVLLATRPYGATPIAGMFAGAQYFLVNDPSGPQQTDTYVQGNCRNEYIILLTDGVPNLDMQTLCSTAGSPAGKCPFALPQQTAATLYNNGVSVSGQASVETFVIGFAVSSFTDNGQPVKCSDFAKGGSMSSLCDCTKPNLPELTDANGVNYGACCELQCIAQSGGSGSAYFADTQGDLQNALGAILAQIAKTTTTRTTPAFSPLTSAVSNTTSPQTNSSLYLASFNPSPGSAWSGDVQRERFQCTFSGGTFTVPTPTIQTSQGDDFAANLNSHSGPARTFIAYQPAVIGGTSTVDATATIRPYVAANVGDNMGAYSATMFAGAASAVTGGINAAAMNIPAQGCPYVSTTFGVGQKFLTQSQCATMLLDWSFGQSTFGGGPSDFSFSSRYNNALGDIFHANPVAVGPPSALIKDPLYVKFMGTWASRKQVLYVSTNDGLLHAFWGDETKLENNELWAMLLPSAMPQIQSTYPSGHAFLLDGTPVVKDVVWDRNQTTSDPAVWHTMLVSGYGASQRGYYAVDVTNPDPTGIGSGNVPSDPGQNGPVFRWQLTKVPTTNFPLFAAQAAQPAITTLFMDPGDGGGARDIGVAILPGGQNGNPTSSTTGCARSSKTTDSQPPSSSGYQARTNVRCWGTSNPPLATDPVVGRSVTIVRVDTGEVLRTFARKADFSGTYAGDTLLAAHRVTDTALDSPMTGTPMVYPSSVGTDATRFFVGDADGTLWRFDVSSSDPSKWTGELYLDLYNSTVDKASTSWNDGQPFQVTPVLSLDTAGELVINAASGNIQQFDSTGVNYVYSITEKIQGSPAKLRANVNWYLGPSSQSGAGIGFAAGERVSGPMTVFNGVLYFSTYAAAPPGSQSCTSGMARLWGRDYVTPDVASDLSQGGIRILQPPAPNAPQTPAPVYIQPSDYDSSVLGRVIPGVAITAAPACASLGSASSDPYVAGTTHQSPQNFTAGSYSLYTQIGGTKGSNGVTTKPYQQQVPSPVAPTTIDSWAAVLE